MMGSEEINDFSIHHDPSGPISAVHLPSIPTINGSDHSVLDPPSYDDVVLSPSNGHDSSEPSDPSPDSDFIEITVFDPQKKQEKPGNSLVPGGNCYITYQITTRTSVAEFRGSNFSVRRRFKDVVKLADRLSESYRGFFVPPRPDKSVVERQMMQKLECVEQRHAGIKKYLRRLARHPAIRTSEELRVFLQVEGKLPLPATPDVSSRVLDGVPTVSGSPQLGLGRPAKGGRDLLRKLKELKQSVVNDWGGVRPAVVEEDGEFLVKKERMRDLGQQLSDSSQ